MIRDKQKFFDVRLAHVWMWVRLFIFGVLVFSLVACGGGASQAVNAVDGSAFAIAEPPLLSDANVMAVAVEAGPGANVNIPYVSVTVCRPGTQNCVVVDHILLDTGSTGLRLLRSAMNGLALPDQTQMDGSTNSPALLECAQFINFPLWGPVKKADIVLGGERASSVPIQIFGDSSYPTIPNGCGSTSTVVDNSADLNANGILGVGVFVNDRQTYYGCRPYTTNDNCTVTVAPSRQVQNPVALLPTNNNGVVLQLPSVPPEGTARADGFLILGIATQANNKLGNAKIVDADERGFFSTNYRGASLTGFTDSGSNSIFVDDAGIPLCTGLYKDFYCPDTTLGMAATIPLRSGSVDVKPFQVGNAASVLAAPNYAVSSLAAPAGARSFDWGLPFFYGRRVYTGVVGRNAALVGAGALVAYSP